MGQQTGGFRGRHSTDPACRRIGSESWSPVPRLIRTCLALSETLPSPARPPFASGQFAFAGRATGRPYATPHSCSCPPWYAADSSPPQHIRGSCSNQRPHSDRSAWPRLPLASCRSLPARRFGRAPGRPARPPRGLAACSPRATTSNGDCELIESSIFHRLTSPQEGPCAPPISQRSGRIMPAPVSAALPKMGEFLAGPSFQSIIVLRSTKHGIEYRKIQYTKPLIRDLSEVG